jgi:hypothetical protein
MQDEKWHGTMRAFYSPNHFPKTEKRGTEPFTLFVVEVRAHPIYGSAVEICIRNCHTFSSNAVDEKGGRVSSLFHLLLFAIGIFVLPPQVNICTELIQDIIYIYIHHPYLTRFVPLVLKNRIWIRTML